MLVELYKKELKQKRKLPTSRARVPVVIIVAVECHRDGGGRYCHSRDIRIVYGDI